MRMNNSYKKLRKKNNTTLVYVWMELLFPTLAITWQEILE